MADFKQYDIIQITAINKPIDIASVSGSGKGYTRLPKVGDKATIVEIYEKSGNIGLVLECVSKDGYTYWLRTFKLDEIDFIVKYSHTIKI